MQIETTIIRKCYFAVLIFLLFSCGDNKTVWYENKSIQDCMWNKDNALVYTIPVEDTISMFSLSFNIRNRDDYNFQNLYLFVRTKAPNGGVTIDTVNYNIANPDGSWTGKGGMFSKYSENDFMYRKYIRFPVKGNYTVSIRQGMREDNLKGIASVGLNLHTSL